MDDGETSGPHRRPRRVKATRTERTGRRLVLAAVALCAVALVAAWQGARRIESEILKSEATADAATWVDFVRADIADLEGLLSGRAVTALDRAVFDGARRAGRLIRYELRDARGRLILGDASGARGPATGFTESDGPRPVVVLERAAGDGAAPAVRARVRVPLDIDGAPAGEVTVEFDRGARAAALRRLADTGLAALGLVLAAVALAMAGYVRWSLRARRRTTEELRLAKGNAEQATELARRALARAQSANSGKSAFFAAMSHEIRTPMSGVLGMANLLHHTSLSDEQRDYVQAIRTSGAALLTIINDVLDYSKMESGNVDLDIVEFDLVDLVEGVAMLLASQTDEKGLDIWTFVPTDAPRRVAGDEGRLRQVLLNLAGNAVKFTDRGAVWLTASVAPSDDDGLVLRLEVRDTGIGIADDAQAKLFAQFAQADSSIGRTYGGTGLGLAISKQLVELMGGEIGVSSVRGKGSRFWATAKLAVAGEDVEPAWSAPLSLDGARALVVDRSAYNRDALRQRLESFGMSVTVAVDGPTTFAALDRAVEAARPFAVALIDAVLDDMSGDELMTRVRDRWEFAATKLVAIRGLTPRADNDAGPTAPADETIRKPVIQSVLLDRVAGVFEERPVPTLRPPAPDGGTADAPDLADPPRRLRILLAEDNQVNQKVISVMLGKAGHAVDVVANGDDAIDAVGRGAYDVVLMDVQMPKVDGVAATRQIRRLPGAASRVPIVALTARAMAGDRESFLSSGMNDYVSKPIVPADLAAAIERQCGVATRLDTPLAAPQPAAADAANLAGLLDTIDDVAEA